MSVIRQEDLDDHLRRIVETAEEFGRQAEQAARETDDRIVARRLPNKPDLTDTLITRLREVLEDEIVVAKPATGEALIEEREKEREIAKRALAHIKLPRLREIAEDLNLPKGGTLDDVADRVVRAFKGDRAEIARLVVTYESEPPPERRFTTRLFQIWEAPDDVTATAERVRLFARRYIRTGIARWFIIDDVTQAGTTMLMKGIFRFYRADATKQDEEYTLWADPDSASARLRLRTGETSTEVEAKGDRESRAIISAFQHASGLRWRDTLPVSQRTPEGELQGWEPRSVLMVDLLNARFGSDSIEIFNLNVAGFETAPASRDEEDSTRPSVRSVRFQGRHLLDSRTACELLVRGQGLVELGALVRYTADAENSYVLPVTLRLERDHATVMTGFGAHPVQAARDLQDLIVAGVRRSFRGGLMDEASLRQLAQEIRTRAEQDEPVNRATIFAPRVDEDEADEAGSK